MFRDSSSVVDSSIASYTKIHNRYILFSFYYMREAILDKIIEYYFINGKINSTSILSKYLGLT